MSDLISEAQAIATRVHDGQTDTAGIDYVTHPARVAELVRDAGGSEHAIATAWLHDVLAKTDVTPYDLLSAGIPEDVVHAVEAVTMRAGEGLGDYFARLTGSPLAVQVKHADLDEKAGKAWVGIPDQNARRPVDAGSEPAPQSLDVGYEPLPQPLDTGYEPTPEPVDAGYETPSELIDSGYEPAHEAFDSGYDPGDRAVDETPW